MHLQFRHHIIVGTKIPYTYMQTVFFFNIVVLFQKTNTCSNAFNRILQAMLNSVFEQARIQPIKPLHSAANHIRCAGHMTILQPISIQECTRRVEL